MPAARSPQPASKPPAAPVPIQLAHRGKPLPQAGHARGLKPRHWGLWLSFLLLVLLPVAGTTAYLYTRAVDRYASSLGFGVRAVQQAQTLDMLNGLIGSGGATAGDAAMVYAYLQSQDLVQALDAKLDLRKLFSQYQTQDPVFSFDPSGGVEDLLRYWNRAISLSYDSGTGLIVLRVTAFSPEAAQQIARAAFSEAAHMINDVSATAQQEITQSARRERDDSSARLERARVALRMFRARQQILDPGADATGRLGLLNSLQEQLAQALIDLDLLHETTRKGDPRIYTTEHKIAALRARIAEERSRFGAARQEEDASSYAAMMAEYERLSADQEFAQKAYLAALAAYDAAQEQARQQSLYLAAYEQPTLAERSIYPDRPLLISIVGGFALLIWGALALIYYSLRDRR